jgi:hypothetical protein
MQKKVEVSKSMDIITTSNTNPTQKANIMPVLKHV